MTNRSAYTKNLNRERVLEFENEMQGKLATLADVERDLADVSEKRKTWLNSISRADDTGMDVYISKINVLKLKSQLSFLHMQLDVLRLQGHYEAQALNYLVASTQPLSQDESIDERKKQLLHIQRQDNDIMMNLLEQSLKYRIQLGNINYDLNSQLNIMNNEIIIQQNIDEQEYNEKIAYYISKMKNTIDISKTNYHKITEEYLILRHNTKISKEILTRNQNQTKLARIELQSCLDNIILEANQQREKLENNSNIELKFLTQDLRNKVINKEIELENITNNVKNLKKKQKKELSTFKKELRMYNKKYVNLQNKRKNDIKLIQSELAVLRQAVGSAEYKLYETRHIHTVAAAGGEVAPTTTAIGGGGDRERNSPTGVNSASITNGNSGSSSADKSTILKLRKMLRELECK